MCLSENFYPCLLALRIHVLSDFDFRNDVSFALFLSCFKARNTDTQRELLFKNLKLLGLSRHFGLKSFGVFSARLSASILVLWVPCPCFLLFNHYFYKKTKPLYPTAKYLFGIGIWIWIWIWAAKNLRFSLRVSLVIEN